MAAERERIAALTADVPAFEGAPHDESTLDVRLRREDVKHVDAPLKRPDAQAYGYRDGLDLARDVAANWTEAYAGHNGRLVLAMPNGEMRVAVVELIREKGFYRMSTAGLRRREQLPDEPLWQRPR